MPTPENRVKMFIDKWMKQWYPNALKYSPPGVGRFGKNGMPDRLWFIGVTERCGLTVAIEAKAPGNCLSDLQLMTLTKMQELGIVAATVTGKNMDKMLDIKSEIDRRIAKIKLMEELYERMHRDMQSENGKTSQSMGRTDM